MQIERIVVALDDSPRAPDVLRAALTIASRHEARLSILRAVGLSSAIPEELLTIRPDEVPRALQRIERKRLSELVASENPTVPFDLFVEVGRAADVICQFASRIRASLVIVGSHGYRGLDRLLGTTAERVANTAPCSVLVVRPPMQ